MRRLLHVENDPLVARAVKRLLRINGYEVGSILSYEEGCAVSGRFDVAVMDVDLGDGDGVDLAARLLAQDLVTHVVFFTARTDADTAARAEVFGPVVSKTAGVDLLLATIGKCFQGQSTSHTRRRAGGDDQAADREVPKSSTRIA
jgi:DNA-binding response OmpR family regulator